MRAQLDRLDPARAVWEALDEGRVLLTPWHVAQPRGIAADEVDEPGLGFAVMVHGGFGDDEPRAGIEPLLERAGVNGGKS
jgi:hypothetical protein